MPNLKTYYLKIMGFWQMDTHIRAFPARKSWNQFLVEEVKARNGFNWKYELKDSMKNEHSPH